MGSPRSWHLSKIGQIFKRMKAYALDSRRTVGGFSFFLGLTADGERSRYLSPCKRGAPPSDSAPHSPGRILFRKLACEIMTKWHAADRPGHSFEHTGRVWRRS